MYLAIGKPGQLCSLLFNHLKLKPVLLMPVGYGQLA